MRLYTSMFFALGLAVTACGKKTEPPAPTAAKPEPAKPEPAKPEPEPAKPEPKPEPEPAKPEPAKPEPTPAAVDRPAAVQASFEAFAAGKLDEAFAPYADDAVWYNVGSPEGAEVKGKAAMLEAMKAMPMPAEAKVKASRIIESGDLLVVEYILAGKVTVKAEDGTESTREIALPTALLLQFNADGKIAAAWSFRDQVNAAQQMGAVPGLAADFKPLALAETTEIVKGEGQAAIKDLYTTFFGKIATPENIDAAIAEHVGDDFKLVDAMSGLTFDKASVGAWVKGFTSMLGGMTVTVDQAIMAGDFAAFVVTNKATYKGGIEGIEAKDQQVTWKSLDIVKAKDGKFSSFMTYMNMMEMLGQLGALGGAGDKPADPAAAAPKELGVASCDAYVKAMTACLERMPEVARGPAADAFKSVVAQWEKVAAAGDAQKASLEAGCKAALDASKTSMGAACPDVKWE